MIATAHRWAVVFCVLAVAGAAAAEDALSTGDVVSRVQARFDSTADLRADVEQEIAVVALGRSMTAKGTVAFKRPGRMRWELEGDEKQTIVSDGETIWFYQPEDEQVLKAPLDSVFRSATPVSFLTGVGKIADDFSASVTERNPDSIVLRLDPKRANGDMGRLDLVVDPDQFDIREARVTDPVGNLTVLRFSNLRRNLGVPAEEFRFEVPPGIDVVEAPIGY